MPFKQEDNQEDKYTTAAVIDKHQQLNPTSPVSHVFLKNSDFFQKLTQAGTLVHYFLTKAIILALELLS